MRHALGTYNPLTDDALRWLCTADDAARILGVTRWGVRYLCRAGELRLHGKTAGGLAIFMQRDVERLAGDRAEAQARAAAAAIALAQQAAAATRAEQLRLEQRAARLARVGVHMLRCSSKQLIAAGTAAPPRAAQGLGQRDKPLHNGGVRRARSLKAARGVA